MTAPLPDRWEDEPWPLDDPTPGPSLRPTNWSDTHDQPPQVADLADEAWQRAVDRGISMERALVELQDEALHPSFHTGGIVRSAAGTFSIGWSGIKPGGVVPQPRTWTIDPEQLDNLLSRNTFGSFIDEVDDPGNGA